MTIIKNPILRGFNPDPSIIRAGEDYYIATSTFEWFPGVQIHHSKDLKNWELVNRPLNRITQLDLRGLEDSRGIWAPCLSYDKGTYYLVYTIVKSIKGRYMDCHNYLVTCTDICGEWSEPVYLNSIGFDPSLFHDDDGKKWFVGVTCDQAPGHGWFGGIVLQEYCEKQKKLTGQIKTIFMGTELGYTEGPHIYKKDSWYYLITAEGGTGYDHAVTVARSKCIEGPYEVDPENPMLTSRGDEENPIQKAGHADIVEAHDGGWYMVHLCGRPLEGTKKCILGRETCIQRVFWTEEGWLRLEQGGRNPYKQIKSSLQADKDNIPVEKKYTFAEIEQLPIDFQTLRIPLGEDTISLTERPGYLRLKGKESLNSIFHQAFVARRFQTLNFTAQTCVEFEPDSYRQMAGLVLYYNTRNYHYLYVSRNEKGKCIGVITCNDEKVDMEGVAQIQAEGWKQFFLKAQVHNESVCFYCSADSKTWEKIGDKLDATILSDEHNRASYRFTGAFAGICCQDLLYGKKHADFKYFSYDE